MAYITVQLHESDDAIRVDVLRPTDGSDAFLVMRVADLSVFLPGYGRGCAYSARSLAAELLAAADTLDPVLTVAEAVQS